MEWYVIAVHDVIAYPSQLERELDNWEETNTSNDSRALNTVSVEASVMNVCKFINPLFYINILQDSMIRSP